MQLIKNILISIFIFTGCTVLAELGLSSFYDFPNGYFVAVPETGFTWEKDTVARKGINHDAHVHFDHLGSRSTSDLNRKEKAIIAIGGSTTACYSLDQNKTWTALLEEKLGEEYWVGNFGKPGSFSSHHVLQLEEITTYHDLPNIERVIIMMGVNDFSASLTDPSKYIGLSNFDIKINAFKSIPDSVLPWHRALTLAKLFKKAKDNVIKSYNRKTHREVLEECRQCRLETKEINQLPDLTKALDFYENNTMKMIQFAKRKNVEITFISQAVLWNKNLSQEEKNIVYSCIPKQGNHYSVAALVEGMQLFNKRLEKVCLRENIPFIWNDLPSSSSYFFDDYHYTEKGAEVVAESLFQKL
jgi:lysophospholipase L1-like esterase